MEFKKLEIKPEGSWLKRTISNPHTKKSMIYIAIGAIAGVIYFFVTNDKQMADVAFGELFQSAVIGAFFGFFITNNPCARNKC
jgi:hypothetical protein